MKIEKVNENQIRCTLTKQDLADRQINLRELAYGSEQINTIVNRDSNPEEPRVLALEDLVSVATSSQILSIDKPR